MKHFGAISAFIETFLNVEPTNHRPMSESRNIFRLFLTIFGYFWLTYILLFSDLTASNVDEEEESKTDETTTLDTPTPEMLPKIDFKAAGSDTTAAAASHWLRSCINEPSKSSTLLSPPTSASKSNTANAGWYEMTETSRFSEGDESIADFSVFNDSKGKSGSGSMTSFVGAFGASTPANSATVVSTFAPISTSSPRRQLFTDDQKGGPLLAESSNGSSTLGEVPKEENANLDFPLESLKHAKNSIENDTSGAVAVADAAVAAAAAADRNKVIISKNSGLFMYVDIHGHASKRGIFM